MGSPFLIKHVKPMKYLYLPILLLLSWQALAQNSISFSIKDAQDQSPLVGVTVFIAKLNQGTVSNGEGEASLSEIPNGSFEIQFSYIGYEALVKELTFPNQISNLVIEMTPDERELNEVVVSTNRANRSVANTPSRIEVLTDEVEEAATMDPSKIAHLLMHTTGVQVQQTSATSGSASVRIQGQYGRYTQILKDGFPIYGGFTGGLGILQIPPLDLRQVEFVKGSASTLYGGGAIAGLINLISKEPQDQEEASLHVNFSHIGNLDLNSFYSKKLGKVGLTIFASNNTNAVYDVDNDGFSDVPQVRKFNFNPRIFYYLDDKTTLSLGGTFTNENRIGGDVKIVEGFVPNEVHNYFERNKSLQVTSQFKIERIINDQSRIELKNSTNTFDRNIFLNNYAFAGKQFSTFSEFNYAYNQERHNLIVGANIYSDKFTEEEIESPRLRNQSLLTFGAFVQHIWDIKPQIALETGLRTDYNTDYGFFALPKFAIIYKPVYWFTARLGGGLGYKLPTIFTEDAESFAFENIAPIDPNIHEAEKSLGLNGELTFRPIETELYSLSLTTYFFYNKIDRPLILDVQNTDFSARFRNSNGYFETQGIEALIKAEAGPFHLYLGYTFVDAIRNDAGETIVLPLTPRHSFHGDLMFVQDHKWRVGIDAEYESRQTLLSGRRVRSLIKAGFLAERTINQFSIYINLENWTDTRQTRYESLVLAPFENPRFTEVWAPLDGFIFNAGFKIKF